MSFEEWYKREGYVILGTGVIDESLTRLIWEAAQAAQREQDRRALESAQRTLLTLQGMPELGRLREGIAAPLREIAAAIRNQEQS